MPVNRHLVRNRNMKSIYHDDVPRANDKQFEC